VRLELIARNGPDFRDFQPYVPAIDDAGRVAFQARLPDGSSAVFLGDGQCCERLLSETDGLAPCSHPDRNTRGELAIYAVRPDGSTALLGLGAGGAEVLLDSRSGRVSGIGPLGPVIDEQGQIALRTTLADGREAVCTWRGGECRIELSAREGEALAGFQGLPVVAGEAGLLVRADRVDGREVLCRVREGRTELLAQTGEGFRALSAFPAMNERGDLAFGALDPQEVPLLVHRVAGQEQRLRPASESGIVRVRGALLAGAALYCTADTRDGGVAVFRRRGDALERVLGTGDAFLGERIRALALNPVSVNDVGQLAIRLLFANGGQAIARLSPGSSNNL
jgi:hypothetical protein